MSVLQQAELDRICQSVAAFSQDAISYAIEQAHDAEKGEQLVQRLREELTADDCDLSYATVALIVVLGEAQVETAIPTLLPLATDPARMDSPLRQSAAYALQRMGRPALLAAMAQIENLANRDARILGYEVLQAAADADDATRLAVAEFCLARLRIELAEDWDDEDEDDWTTRDAVIEALAVLREPGAVGVLEDLLAETDSPWDADLYEDWLADLEEREQDDNSGEWQIDWPEQCQQWAEELEQAEQAVARLNQLDQLQQANADLAREFRQFLIKQKVVQRKATASAQVIQSWLDFAANRGLDVHDLKPQKFRQVLMRDAPAELCADGDYFRSLAASLGSFLEFLQTSGRLQDRGPFDTVIQDAKKHLPGLAEDQRRWSHQKLFHMAGLEAGYDMDSPQGLINFMTDLAGSFLDTTEETDEPDDQSLPPVTGPILRIGPRLGPNEPCPCGSGKKYKKCCGK